MDRDLLTWPSYAEASGAAARSPLIIPSSKVYVELVPPGSIHVLAADLLDDGPVFRRLPPSIRLAAAVVTPQRHDGDYEREYRDQGRENSGDRRPTGQRRIGMGPKPQNERDCRSHEENAGYSGREPTTRHASPLPMLQTRRSQRTSPTRAG